MMRKRVRQKRCVTLIEMMVVILLIGLIAGVLAYNFRGSLDQGKLFKTREGMQRLENLLAWEMAAGRSTQDIQDNWKIIAQTSPLGGREHDVVNDGWGQPYEVTVDQSSGQITIRSQAYDRWLETQGR